MSAAPVLELDGAHPLMQNVRASRFQFDPSDLLSEPGLESRMSQYLVRLRFIQSQAVELLDQQAELLELVQDSAGS